MGALATEVKDLTREDYDLIRRLVYEKSGINLGDEKMQLVRARLGKRLRRDGFGSFREYYEYVRRDRTGEELCGLLDAISTNTTHLFREIKHFKLLEEVLGRWLADKNWRQQHAALRMWSAASSSGEEPYSIAMVAHNILQRLPGIELKILATDISVTMLRKARQGIFDAHRTGTVPPQYRTKYLTGATHQGDDVVQVVPELRRLIKFARFNLMSPTFPFRHGFDVIFCRNVMIYFDKPTQTTLVNKLAGQLREGGYLLIGHSESLNNLKHPLSYVEPTVYHRPRAKN